MTGDRWAQARDSVMDVAEQAAQYDADGVDVYFLNDSRKGLGLTVSHIDHELGTPANVQVPKPSREPLPRRDAKGSHSVCPFLTVKNANSLSTGLRIEQLLLEYISNLERMQQLKNSNQLPAGQSMKPMNLIVITDGGTSLGIG
jgi:hypothetical protein